MPKESDGTLVNRILEGDTKAYEILVRKYQGAVFGLAYHLVGNREDAEDLAQEAFFQAYLHLNQLREQDKFAGWLKQITANLCRMWLRQEKGTFISLEEISKDGTVFRHQEILSDELHKTVMSAIHTLPEQSRLVLTLYYTDGLSYREIGDFLQLPLSTIKWRLYDARKKLKEEVMKMVKEGLKSQKPELNEKVTKKLTDEIMGAFGRMSRCIDGGERGIVQLNKRTITQTGGRQWVKVVWDHFGGQSGGRILSNPEFWKLATKEDDTEIKAEKGEKEMWDSFAYTYLLKKRDGGPVSDSVDVYAYYGKQPTLDDNGIPEVIYVPISFGGDFLEDLKKVGFEKVAQREVAHLRMGHQWENSGFFETVIQHQFKHETGRDVYLEVSVPATQEKYFEFNPQGVNGWHSGSGVRKAYIFYPHTEENSAVTAIWAHEGQYISVYCPLGFPVTREKQTDETRKEVLAITQMVESFFNVVADRLGYPSAPEPKKQKKREKHKIDSTDWHRWRDYLERQKELGRRSEVDPKEAYRKLKENPPKEGDSTKAHYGLWLRLAEARANTLPISPPENASVKDIGEIDLSALGFKLASSEKSETSMFGVLSLPLPDNSVHLEYRGTRRKKVSIDLIKFDFYEQAGEFYWSIKHQNAAYALNSDHPYSPMKIFRSPIHPNRHVNAIWGDKKWIINIRIPITKPNAEKSRSCPLKEEELREEVAGLLLSHFAKLGSI